jgi:serine phosphatase RsbU (regulator of sigma subunit)/anti-sigma regulatory factor (Ser/Thr protein kinase)
MIPRVDSITQPDGIDAAGALAALQQVTDAALGTLTLDELLAELLDRVSEILRSDTAAILLVDDADETLTTRAARGIEAGGRDPIRIPIGQGFAGRVALERRAVAVDLDTTEVINPALRASGIRSLLGAPLVANGRVIGVIHVGTLRPQEFAMQDHLLLHAAADRAAMAIEHARLYEQERATRVAAERAAFTLTALQRVTDAALAYLPLDELLVELLDRIAEILHSDTAAILLLEENGEMLRARAAKGIEEEVEQGVRLPLGKGFAGRIAADRRPVAIADVDHADILNPILREKGIRSLLGVPLLVEGRVLGVLHVGTLRLRDFTADEESLLQLAGDRAAMAIEHARLFEQRRIVESLQRVLLPGSLPDIPGLEFAARYRPAAVGAHVGGDWYDVFALPAGKVGIVIGDVVGTGVAAAALMAQLRTALRAYAFEGHEPAAVLERINRLLEGGGGPSMTTVAYMVLDPETGGLRVASAGHLPPLVVAPDGTARFLEVEGDMPLGVSRSAMYRDHDFDVATGTRLVLVTDGAVEVPGEPLEAGLERLRALAAATPDGEELCELVAGGAVASRERDDDIAVVATRLTPLPDVLDISLPADARVLPPMRHLLRRWLKRWGAVDDEVYDITVAVQEACANAVEHAYAAGPAAFEVHAEHVDGAIVATITDRGGWRDPRGINRGRGLPMMEALMDAIDVQRDEHGTAVTLRRTIGKGTAT